MSHRDVKNVLAACLALLAVARRLVAPAHRRPRQRRHPGFEGTTR